MQFTIVKSKEKDYVSYLKSETLVHSQYQHEKNVSQLFGSAKNWFLAIYSLTNTVAAIWREKKWIPAIWRPKNVVHNCQEQEKSCSYLEREKVNPCYFQTKKCSSQLL